MKKILLSISTLALFMPAALSQSGNYDRSVYKGYHKVAANPAASMGNREKAAAAFPGWNSTYDKLNGSVTRLFGPAITLQGKTVLDKAQYCMNVKLKDLGITPAQWVLTRDANESFASFVDFKQYMSGKEVVQSRLSFRFTNDGKLIGIQIKNYGIAGSNATPALSRESILSSDGLLEGIKANTVKEKELAADWVWFPVPSAAGYELHPAYRFSISLQAKGELPSILNGYIDAMDGSILDRSNEVNDAVTVTVKGDVNTITVANPSTKEPLANLLVEMNGVPGYTDTNGTITTNASGNVDVVTRLQGRWVRVVDDPWGWTPEFASTGIAPGTYTLDIPVLTSPASNSRHTNAYYHTNKVHDHVKKYLPSFTLLDIAMVANVDLFDSNFPNGCNAFYSNSTINFLPAQGQCPSYAEFADVVYHEYGHAVSHKFYQQMGANRMRNSALNEGNSDVWAMGIVKDGLIGRNYNGLGSIMRRYDISPKVYPGDIQSESHADGEIIAGIWYDIAVSLNSFERMTELFTKTYYDLPDGFSGQEGEVYADVLLSALQNDDDDNNLLNGTPNSPTILNLFARHGITLFDAVMTHTEVSNQLANVPVNISASITATSGLQSVKLNYRTRQSGAGGWNVVDMANNSNTYTAQIPAQGEQSIVEYYIAAYTSGAQVKTLPEFYNPASSSRENNMPYQFTMNMVPSKVTDFETDETSWTIGNAAGDNATGGKWIQAKPMQSNVRISGTGLVVVQTGNDHTTGAGRCLVTGNASSVILDANNADVDRGTTTAISPSLDLSGFKKPYIQYHRWYSNNRGGNPGTDVWQVMISDAAQSTPVWVAVEETNMSDHSWRRRIFDVKEFLPAAQQVKIKFMATDMESTMFGKSQSTTEAAVDDFIIYDAVATSVDNTVAKAAKANIYPIPADAMIMVSLPAAGKGNIGLYDLTGKMLHTQTLDAQSLSYVIPTGAVTPGNYVVMVQTDGAVQVQKVVVKH